VISRLACSLAGQSETIRIEPGSLAYQAYGKGEATESYRCNFGLNPQYRLRILRGQVVVTGVGADGEVRIIELRSHPFFVATLFLPQLTSSPDSPHPLIIAYLKAVMEP
jgi:CTP synthase (UTP-ammonia lyase)